MLNSFIRLHEQSKWDYKDKHIVCYFCSNGWDTAIGKCIVDVINDIENFTLVAQAQIASCWFDIFFFAKCKKKVSPICRWMCHIGWFDTNINHRIEKEQWWSQRVIMEDIKISSNKNAKFYKKMGMKKSDLKRYKQDNDINYSSRQLKMFVNNQKQIWYIQD
jgi:hypothetical protein